MKRFMAVLAVSMLVVVGASGCKQKGAQAPGPQPAMMPAPAPAGNALTGKVVETMNAGGYTYVLIENGGKKTWVAGPQTTVKVGQQVTCQPGAVMNNFTSPTLKRTFDSIIFSPGIR